MMSSIKVIAIKTVIISLITYYGAIYFLKVVQQYYLILF